MTLWPLHSGSVCSQTGQFQWIHLRCCLWPLSKLIPSITHSSGFSLVLRIARCFCEWHVLNERLTLEGRAGEAVKSDHWRAPFLLIWAWGAWPCLERSLWLLPLLEPKSDGTWSTKILLTFQPVYGMPLLLITSSLISSKNSLFPDHTFHHDDSFLPWSLQIICNSSSPRK